MLAGAGQCDVPKAKAELGGMASRGFMTGASPAQQLMVPANGAAGASVDVMFMSSGDNIAGFLVSAKKGTDFYGKFTGTAGAHSPTSCAAGAQTDATLTHGAKVGAKSATVSYAIPAAAANGDKIAFTAVVLLGDDTSAQTFYTLSAELTVGAAASGTTTTVAPAGNVTATTTAPVAAGNSTAETTKAGNTFLIVSFDFFFFKKNNTFCCYSYC